METQFGSLAVHLKTLKVKLDAKNAQLDARHERMMACLGKTEATDLKVNPEEMQSEAEYRDVPMEHAAVKPVGGRKKRHRGRHLAAGRRGPPKDLTRGDCGSWKGRISGAPIGYSGRVALRWEQCNGFDQRVARPQPSKHIPTHVTQQRRKQFFLCDDVTNNRDGVFCVVHAEPIRGITRISCSLD
jgi:hypothetical protein